MAWRGAVGWAGGLIVEVYEVESAIRHGGRRRSCLVGCGGGGVSGEEANQRLCDNL